MKRSLSIISLLLLLCVLIASFTACDMFGGDTTGDQTGDVNNGSDNGDGEENKEPEHVHVDYVSALKLDMNSPTLKQVVELKQHIDGDTTHFHVPKTLDSTGVMKARYLAVNTPESTGRIEEWGKAASNFTKEKLTTAKSIIVESNSAAWEHDGNGRYLVWVWYQPAEGGEYRNLNLELLQNGLAAGSKTTETIYGDKAVAAIAQATTEKLYIFSQEKDPDFPYGAAESVTLKELRLNIADYVGKKVSVEGVVTFNADNTEYIEALDPETGLYFGIQIFDGYQNQVTTMLKRGNYVRVVGVITEFSGTYQISSIDYNPMKPTDPANSTIISKGNAVAYRETTAEEYLSTVEIQMGEDEQPLSVLYREAVLSTSISMKNLYVKKVYTTTNPSASDIGAMTLTCEIDGMEISVRTEVLYDADGKLVTADYFYGKTIDFKGIVDYFDYNNTGNGTYQIRVYNLNHFTVH